MSLINCCLLECFPFCLFIKVSILGPQINSLSFPCIRVTMHWNSLRVQRSRIYDWGYTMLAESYTSLYINFSLSSYNCIYLEANVWLCPSKVVATLQWITVFFTTDARMRVIILKLCLCIFVDVCMYVYGIVSPKSMDWSQSGFLLEA